MFGCKFQWIWSIGYAVRNDVEYPDISELGNNEAERRFNYFANKYPKIKQFMSHFTIIENQYGPGSTWVCQFTFTNNSIFKNWPFFFVIRQTIRKQLTYQTQVVSGPGWATIGDGVGFTNPLHSPGISAGMGSSSYAAELTREVLSKKTEEERRAVWKPYDDWCAAAIPSLNRMNTVRTNLIQSPSLLTLFVYSSITFVLRVLVVLPRCLSCGSSSLVSVIKLGNYFDNRTALIGILSWTTTLIGFGVLKFPNSTKLPGRRSNFWAVPSIKFLRKQLSMNSSSFRTRSRTKLLLVINSISAGMVFVGTLTLIWSTIPSSISEGTLSRIDARLVVLGICFVLIGASVILAVSFDPLRIVRSVSQSDTFYIFFVQPQSQSICSPCIIQIVWQPELTTEEISTVLRAADAKAIGRVAIEYLAAQKETPQVVEVKA